MIQNTVVMFADVSGSSGLYKQLGDAAANHLVSGKLHKMAQVIRACNGIIIKTIGDEIMAHFPSPNKALNAAIGIQKIEPRTPLIRIGMAWGEVIEKNHDLFGQTVNDAAAVAKIARGGQVIITHAHSEQLRGSPVKLAAFDIVRLKGGSNDTMLYRVEWETDDEEEPEDQTTLSRVVSTQEAKLSLTLPDSPGRLSLLELRPPDTPYRIGRNPETCHLMISAGYVSRDHCHIDYEHGHFILHDHSSNGTHLVKGSDVPIYLRRNSSPLLGEGTIGVGHDPQEPGPHIIGFKC